MGGHRKRYSTGGNSRDAKKSRRDRHEESGSSGSSETESDGTDQVFNEISSTLRTILRDMQGMRTEFTDKFIAQDTQMREIMASSAATSTNAVPATPKKSNGPRRSRALATGSMSTPLRTPSSSSGQSSPEEESETPFMRWSRYVCLYTFITTPC